MRRKWILCLIILCRLMCGYAMAETSYHTLCEKYGLSNADVMAWLEIPGASICEPVMRHPDDDAYYAAHDPAGSERTTGALYVQARYNSGDFSDPVTLIYGSSASETALFGKLQELYSGSFDQCKNLYLHLPQQTCEYVVFAAIPYSSIHILHYYDFHTERRYNSFFDSVFSIRALSMHLDEANRPEFGDRVMILSTGLRGDRMQRYLVMAKLINE